MFFGVFHKNTLEIQISKKSEILKYEKRQPKRAVFFYTLFFGVVFILCRSVCRVGRIVRNKSVGSGYCGIVCHAILKFGNGVGFGFGAVV